LNLPLDPLDPMPSMELLDGGCEDAAKLPLDNEEFFISMETSEISVGDIPDRSSWNLWRWNARGSLICSVYLLKSKFPQAGKSKNQ